MYSLIKIIHSLDEKYTSVQSRSDQMARLANKSPKLTEINSTKICSATTMLAKVEDKFNVKARF